MDLDHAGSLLVLLIVVHFCTPYLVHLFVRHIKLRRLQHATRQALDECHVTSARYSREVAEFRARHSYALLANSVTSQMLAELTAIQQLLVLRVRSIQQRLQRERMRNTVRRFSWIASCSSVTSVWYYCALWIIMHMLTMPEFDVTACACLWLAYVAVFAWFQHCTLCSSSRAKLLRNIILLTLTGQLAPIEMQPTTGYGDYIKLFENVEDNDPVECQKLLNNDEQFPDTETVHIDREVGSHNNNQSYSTKQSTSTWAELGLPSPCEWCVNVFCLPWYCQLLLWMSQQDKKKHRVVHKSALLVNVHQPTTASTSDTTSQSNSYQQQNKRNNQQLTALLSNADTKSSSICANSKTVSIGHDEYMTSKTIIDDTTVQADHATDGTIPLSTPTPTSRQSELSTVEASILTLTQRLKQCSEFTLTSDIGLLSADNNSPSFDVDYVSVQLI